MDLYASQKALPYYVVTVEDSLSEVRGFRDSSDLIFQTPDNLITEA